GTHVFDFLQSTIEYRQLGWNIATISALSTIAFTCWQMTALVDQYQTIKTGESVSVSWNTFFGADFMAFIIYGIYAASIAMTFNALLGFGHLLVLWGLLQVKTLTMREWLLLPSIVILPVLMYYSRTHMIDLWFVELTERQLLFLVFSLGTLIALGLQPWEMYRNKSRGDFSFNVLISYTASTGFWIGFAYFATDDLVLRFLVTVGGIEMIICCYLWYKYTPKAMVTT
ncbi:MAG: hypothetical protein AAFO91_14475, partial [Bacteroidota bacterium]